MSIIKTAELCEASSAGLRAGAAAEPNLDLWGDTTMKPESRTVRALSLVAASTVAILLVFSATGQAAPVPPPAPNTGWLLDEGTGSLLADYDSPRGGQIGGTPSPTWSTDTPFVYSDNHSLAYVGSGSSNAQIAGHPSGTQGTISVWVTHDGNGKYIIDGTDGHRTLMYRGGSGTATDSFGVYLNQTSIGSVGASLVPGDGSWTHVAMVWDNSLPTGKQKIYKNGTLFDTKNVTVSAKNPATVFLGSRMSLNETWGGKIDEYALWDTPLSSDQVEWLAANSLRSIARAKPSSPTSAWLFDEGAGPTAFDHVGTNDGTLMGNAAWSTNTPYTQYLGSNRSVWLDGSNTTRVDFGPHSFGTEGTIQMWVYRDTDLDTARYVMDTNDGRTLLYRSGSVWVMYMNGTYVGTIPSELIEPFEWTHLAFTWDNSLPSQKEKIYKNGLLFHTFNSTLGTSDPTTIFLGSRQSLNENWLGGIDEFALFDHALSGYDIEQYYRFSLVGIPEPGTFVLLGFGGVFLAGLGWRRRRRAVGSD